MSMRMLIKRVMFILLTLILVFSMPETALALRMPKSILKPAANTFGNPVVNRTVPYIHQLWDTADSFNGNWACGATSAVMALSYYRKLTPNSITISTPYSHSNDYGYYVSSTYTAFDYTFNRGQNDASGHIAYGGYGHTIEGGGAMAWRIYDYLSKHGLAYEYKDNLTDNSLNDIKQALNDGYLVILGTRLTGNSGHIILVKGYTDDNRLIVNDPYGNKNGANGYGKYDGGNIQYTWQQVNSNGKYMIIVKGVVDSDDNRVLTSGQPVNGMISPNTDVDPYTFSGTLGSIIRITMNKTSGSLDSYLELYGPNGLVAVNDDSNGTMNSQIDATLPANGTYRIVAHSYNYGSNGGYQLALTTTSGDGDDYRWLAMGNSLNGTISPNNDRDTYYLNGTANTIASLRMNRATSMDSYLELYDPNGNKVAENDDGGGNYNSWIVYRFNSSGTYRLIARSYNAGSGGGYTVSASQVRGTNYALNKPVSVSSQQDSSYLAAYATDGNRNSRWSSGNNLNQWLFVDLGQNVAVSQVVIRWEIARATGYGVYYWNGSSWVILRSISNGTGDVDVVGFNATSTRYVAISLWGRDARWTNYSLWEFEVYDAVGALAPTVPPDDPKDPETDVIPLVPLSPYPDGKDAPVLALPSEQEIEPLFDLGTPSITLTISLSDTYGSPTTTLTLSEQAIQPGSFITATATNSHDTDSAQIGSGIVSYRWGITTLEQGETGNVVDQLADQPAITISSENWLPGVYVLSLEVLDDEGNWSEPVTATIQVLYGVYLPLIDR